MVVRPLGPVWLTGWANRGCVLEAFALVQRIFVGGGELAAGVEGGGRGAGDDIDATDRRRRLVAEGVVDVMGLKPQRCGAVNFSALN